MSDGRMAGCLTDDETLAFVLTTASEAEVARCERHIDECARCRAMVAEAARGALDQVPDADAEERSDVAGVVAGRFVLGAPLGAGTLGVVYRARDTQLGRDVALKLLRPERAIDLFEAERRNALLEEARAMARLQHPNVVSVYDAGVAGGRVFVAMELVEGGTLTEWLCREGRSWREIVACFVQAARGLAAAHARGVVHRDFKPDNVLVSSEGGVRVGDFGLARAAPEAIPPGASTAATSLSGTPLYMAPEQWAQRRADARTDQFSFCVALYQALFGRHPFLAAVEGQTLADLSRAVLAGRWQQPPPSVVPARLVAAVMRGLAVAPDDRHPSMDALASELDGAATKRSGRGMKIAALLALGAALAGGAIAAQRSFVAAGACGDGRLDPGEECDDGDGDESDRCSSSCRFSSCGDGVVRVGVEECDDGNTTDGDGCTRSCLRCATGPDELVWGSDSRCYTRQLTPATWHEAQAACASRGGHLVIPSTNAEGEALRAHFFAEPDASYWIGGRDLNRRGRYGWVTGELPPTAHRKLYGSATLPHRMCLHESSDIGVADCKTRRAFICERAPWERRPETNHAYRRELAVGRWTAAAEACRRRGAHLATLTDAQEAAFVGLRFFGTLWIGAQRRPGGAFEWITGEPFTYQRFGEGEPDMPAAEAACVVVSADGIWHDREWASEQDGTLDGPYDALCEAE